MSQKKYIKDILKKFSMQDAKPVATPMETALKLKKEEHPDSNLPYRNLIGALMYLSVATRPDIAHAVSYLGQFNAYYGKEHWAAAKRVIRYLKGTIDLKLTFHKNGDKILKGYADADWASCPLDRRSYTGHCFIKNGAVISWESRKQRTVALSTAEAEYMSLSECTKEAVHLKNILTNLGYFKQKGITIHNDNQAAQQLAMNPIISAKSKHIDIRQHFIRDMVQQNVVQLSYLGTGNMIADIFTKALPRPKYEYCRQELGLLQ